MTESRSDEQYVESLRQLARAVLEAVALGAGAAALTVAAIAWVGMWEGAPAMGLATYLFWPLLVAALTLGLAASRLKRVSR